MTRCGEEEVGGAAVSCSARAWSQPARSESVRGSPWDILATLAAGWY